jgi:hypothetical protein
MHFHRGNRRLYFAVSDIEAVYARAKGLKALAPYKGHGEPAGTVKQRPWGERSFYVVDPGAATSGYCSCSREDLCQ